MEIAKRCNVTVRCWRQWPAQLPHRRRDHEDFLVMKSKEELEERLAFCSRIRRCGPSVVQVRASTSSVIRSTLSS